ncbi:putative mitochondrial protein AtMg00820 [Apium graveolens]|uniref:putative mitochondrial protein AtMg00820 n=1 Tax=Apium graveolens TaxID=4045 RepID=UPI003D7A307A
MLKVEEPVNFREASKEKEWMSAMKVEMDTIERNDTWVLIELPPGHKPIGLKCVFKLKKDSEGNIVKHKARLVAKGYIQRRGIDYNEVFTPVVRVETIRLLAMAAKEGWEMRTQFPSTSVGSAFGQKLRYVLGFDKL